ncbi:MAG: M20/M25/M40 family metallo-hydrolase [Gammaproteobacteria bacterium]|nr:M20/M25/M40 family metallo-hydrolase [Gammaproteobacteria bacterium]MBT8105202.1 M20/M25/M40 family metallo-hydrolase [Gammaproteobacteria bacterium]NNF50068.1 M20/M25/M40 family metallo-hydrolase [Woeseiaceae bacterium]NNK25216.1 M20/M25/M40 family metallo-hydrolase [Woeseiaceae bacterium]
MRRITILLICLLAGNAFGQQSYLIDWEKTGEEAIGHLVDLIRIDTSNPPGNETLAVDYLKGVLDGENIDYEIYALDPERANIVARIKGNGSKRPIMIMGHTDVVGVQRDKWYADPFSGMRDGGFVYGRGALDDKDSVAAGLMIVKLLNRFGVALDRDVIFLAESGEEGTPEVGINFLVEHHLDAINAEFVLAEGGNSVIEDGKVKTVGIETTEKMPRRVTLVARGRPGHGSIPVIDNAVAILAQAVARAGAWQTEVRLNDTTRTYFQRLAEISAPQDAYRYLNVENEELSDEIQQHFLEDNPYHYSISRTSVVPTVVDAGFRRNVVPSEARAILDIRMLPDENVDEFYEKLAEVIDDARIEIVPEHIYRPAAPPSDVDSEMFRILEDVAQRMYAGTAVLPVMSTGATDMAQVRAVGMQAYGIAAARTLEEYNSGYGAHGDNERIAEADFVSFVEYLWNVVLESAATK